MVFGFTEVVLLISLLISVGTTAYSIISADSVDVEQPDLEAESSGKKTDLSNTKSAGEFIKPIYGIGRVGINKVFEESTGTDSSVLHIIGVIGEGPIQGIEKVDGVYQLFFDGEIYTKWEGYVTFEFFEGTAYQDVCSTLQTAFPDWTDPLRYTAYIYVAIYYDKDKFIRAPKITAIVRGLQAYDPELCLSYTTGNPAVVAHDIMTKTSSRGGMQLPIKDKIPAPHRFNSDLIDVTSFIEAKNYCFGWNWTFNSPISDNSPVVDLVTMVCSHYRGSIIYSEGLFKFRYRDSSELSSPVMTIDEDNIVSRGGETSFNMSPVADAFRRPNAMKANFTNSAKNYQADTQVFEDVEAVATEGDYREKEVNLYGFNTIDLVSRMVAYRLERARWGLNLSLTVSSEAMKLDPEDVTSVTFGHVGWVNVPARVVGMTVNNDATVSLTLTEERAELYDLVYNPPPATEWFTTNLLGPNSTIPSVRNLRVTDETSIIRARTFTKLVVTFDPPYSSTYPFWDKAEAWYALKDDLTSPIQSEYRYYGDVEGPFVIENVLETQRYHVRLLSVNVFGQRQAWGDSAYYSHVVLGKTGVPSDLRGVYGVVNGDSVTIYADPVTDADIDGYEVRLGTSWGGSIFISYNKAPSLRLNGVRPGTHTFWMSPKDTSGNYSENPVSCTVTVFLPPGYIIHADLPGVSGFDFSDGTFANTEQYNDNSNYYLRVIGYSERISNNDFELWTGAVLDNWTGTLDSKEETSHTPQSGLKCSRLVGTGGSQQTGAYIDIPINALNRYRFSVWYDLDSYTSGTFYPIYFDFLTDAKVFISASIPYSITAATSGFVNIQLNLGSYMDGEADVNIPVNAAYVRTYAGVVAAGSTMTVYVDNYSFKPIWNQLVEYGTVQIAQPEFLVTTLTANTLSCDLAVGAVSRPNNPVGGPSDYSMRYLGQGTGTGDHYQIFEFENAYMFEDLNYSISVNVWNDSSNSDFTTLQLKYRYIDRDGDETEVLLDSTTDTEQWVLLSGRTDIPVGSRLMSISVFAGQFTDTTDRFYTKDWSVRITEPATDPFTAEVYPFIGCWSSTEQDLGTQKYVRCWAPFEFIFGGSTNTFGGVFGVNGTFGDLGAEYKSFGQLFSPVEAGRFKAKLLYRGGLGEPYKYVDYFEVLSGEVYAQYLMFQITTINPDETSSLMIKEFVGKTYTGPQAV